MHSPDTGSPQPYPGLRSFKKDESDIFFGRDGHIDEMVAKLAEHYFLCITGPSGCGKSSLARTGLMNYLEAGFLPGRGSNWIFCDFSPGDRPIDRLFRALADVIVAESAEGEEGAAGSQGIEKDAKRREQIRQLFYYHTTIQRRTSDLNEVIDAVAGITGRPILVLVDQFEELFRYAGSDSDVAADFVEILLKSAQTRRDIYVVITIRTDELEKCSGYPDLTRMINQSQFLTPILDRYQIQEAIEGPIALWGGRISSDFSTWLLNSLEEEFDKLPLMQHALKLLYGAKSAAQKRRDVALGIDDFIALFKLNPRVDLSSPAGRLALRESLSSQLTKRYDSLPDRLKPAAIRVFCALTAVEKGTRDIRRPCRLGALAQIIGESMEDTRIVVRVFGRGGEAYLRFSPELGENDTVDVTHECILRLWSRLQMEWLPEEKKSADNVVALAGLARDWDEGAGTKSVFRNYLAGAALKWYARDRYQAWFAATRPNPAWAARYLANVHWFVPSSIGPRQLTAEVVFSRIVALLVAATLQRRLFWLASCLAVIGVLVGSSYFSAKFKAAEARRIADTIAITGLPPDATRISVLRSAVDALAQGQTVYQTVWATLQEVYELYRFDAGRTEQSQVHAADFATDGKSVLAIDRGGTLHQWAVADDRKVLREFVIGPKDVNGVPAEGRSLMVSPRGDVAAIGFNDGSVVLLDLTTGENRFKPLQVNGANPHVAAGTADSASVFGLVFSFDGSLLVTSSVAGNIVVWERSPSATPHAGKSSPDDPLEWRVKLNIDLARVRPGAQIWSVDIDRAKQTVVAGLQDGGKGRICFVWLDSMDEPICPLARSKVVKSIKFLPDRPMFVSAGNDSQITIWDFDRSTKTAKPWPLALTEDNLIWSMDISRDGVLLATASWDGSVRVYETAEWRAVNTVAADRVDQIHNAGKDYYNRGIENPYSLRTVRFDATSSLLVTSSLDHTARVWTPLFDRTSFPDLSYRLPAKGAGGAATVSSVALAQTGDRIVFTDETSVYVKSGGEQPKALLVDLQGADGGRVQPHFKQVLFRTPTEIIASTTDPRLIVWTMDGGTQWTARTIALPGDPIAPSRSIAMDSSRTVLAVELREGEDASILLCPLGGKQPWSCSGSENPGTIRLPLGVNLPGSAKKKDCPSKSSELYAAVSKSGRLVAAGMGKCPIEVFERQKPQALRAYTGLGGAVNSLDFSPDEKSLVAASSGWDVLVWDLISGTSRNMGHHTSQYITAARYSPSGQLIASSSLDNTVIITDAKNGDIFVRLNYRNGVQDVAMAATPRGAMMVTGSDLGEVNVMRFFENTGDTQSYAKSVMHNLSP